MSLATDELRVLHMHYVTLPQLHLAQLHLSVCKFIGHESFPTHGTCILLTSPFFIAHGGFQFPILGIPCNRDGFRAGNLVCLNSF
jgi:hypothetical protein